MRGWFRQTTGGLPRQFWFLWTGTLINRLGSFVVIFLAIYLTGARHFSQSQAGLVIGLYGVGGAIGTTAGGVLADRWGRRPTILIAQFGAAGLMLALGFARTFEQIAGTSPPSRCAGSTRAWARSAGRPARHSPRSWAG